MDAGSALGFPDPWLRFCAVSSWAVRGPQWLWGRCAELQAQRLTVAVTGPLSAAPASLARWRAPRSPAQVPSCSAPGIRGGGSSGTRDQPHGVPQWRPGEVGVQGQLDLVSHLPRPAPHTRHDSGLWLEPLDPMEPLQPQLQRGYPATLPGGHRAPSCLWGCSVPGSRHGG